MSFVRLLRTQTSGDARPIVFASGMPLTISAARLSRKVVLVCLTRQIKLFAMHNLYEGRVRAKYQYCELQRVYGHLQAADHNLLGASWQSHLQPEIQGTWSNFHFTVTFKLAANQYPWQKASRIMQFSIMLVRYSFLVLLSTTCFSGPIGILPISGRTSRFNTPGTPKASSFAGQGKASVRDTPQQAVPAKYQPEAGETASNQSQEHGLCQDSELANANLHGGEAAATLNVRGLVLDEAGHRRICPNCKGRGFSRTEEVSPSYCFMQILLGFHAFN